MFLPKSLTPLPQPHFSLALVPHSKSYGSSSLPYTLRPTRLSPCPRRARLCGRKASSTTPISIPVRWRRSPRAPSRRRRALGSSKLDLSHHSPRFRKRSVHGIRGNSFVQNLSGYGPKGQAEEPTGFVQIVTDTCAEVRLNTHAHHRCAQRTHTLRALWAGPVVQTRPILVSEGAGMDR